MARIRTIKPEFWTDGAIVECSPVARLLFIGTWSFADDNGNLDRSAKQIKAQVFPADNLECEPLILELIARGLLVEYSMNGKKYLHIQNFAKHQKIDRPSSPRCPLPDGSPSTRDKSPRTRRGLATEGKVKEGKVREGKVVKETPTSSVPIGTVSPAEAGRPASPTELELTPSSPKAGPPPCPHEQIVALYHELLPTCPQIREWNEPRRRLLQLRWKEVSKPNGISRGYSTVDEGLAWWRKFFVHVSESKLLTGRAPPAPGRSTPFVASLAWMLNSEKFLKIVEQGYE